LPAIKKTVNNTVEEKATFGFSSGQVMKATGGQANPALVNELLRKVLDSTD
jgi:Asp-tRNA(Asn)/Glu-tRNA(Gln) amidotransferase B subunit